MECCKNAVKKFGTLENVSSVVNTGEFEIHYINLNFTPDMATTEIADSIAELLKDENLLPVWGLISGGISQEKEFLTKEILKNAPLMWIQGDECFDDFITSAQFIALPAEKVKYLKDEKGNVIGASAEDANAKYCWLGNIVADNKKSNMEQTAEVFSAIDKNLRMQGMTFLNVVRTWLYLDKLLTWYDDFNIVRTKFFNENDVFKNLVPASTGIGARNSNNTALIIGAFAVEIKNPEVKIAPVDSPLQCPAWDYKSSFARAIEVTTPEYSQVIISGTASIEPGGETVFQDDYEKQIDLTMKVIVAILNERGMTLDDTVRAVAYIRDANQIDVFKKWLIANELEEMAVAFSHCVVCRDDLLFEVELDAVI